MARGGDILLLAAATLPEKAEMRPSLGTGGALTRTAQGAGFDAAVRNLRAKTPASCRTITPMLGPSPDDDGAGALGPVAACLAPAQGREAPRALSATPAETLAAQHLHREDEHAVAGMSEPIARPP